MPGPTTEVLNEDVKELKADIREIRGHLDSLKDDVHRVDVSLARLQTEFGLAKWLLGLSLVVTVSGIGSGLWWASDISAQVRTLNGKVAEKAGDLDAKIGEKFRGMDDRLKAVDEKFKAVDARFDRLESLIIKALDPGRPAMQSKKSDAGADAPVK